jgi:RNA polymerase sigma-54 factor
MHESTISRVTTRKYIHTPRGTYELKYFFSSGVATEDGGSASATAIQAMLRKLVDGEDARKPLSDQALAEELHGKGIQVARRTVAKYREILRIPSSSERQRSS